MSKKPSKEPIKAARMVLDVVIEKTETITPKKKIATKKKHVSNS